MFGFLMVYLSVAIGYAIGALTVTMLSGKTPDGVCGP